MQCAQSIDKFGYASLRSEEVTGGTKMKARITVDSRTNASAEQIDDCVEDGTYRPLCVDDHRISQPGYAAPPAPIVRRSDLKGSTEFAWSSPRRRVEIACYTSRRRPELRTRSLNGAMAKDARHILMVSIEG